MSRTRRHHLRRFTAAAALTLAAGLTLPATATAEPDADPVALAAAEAIQNARGGVVDAAEPSPLGAYEDGMELLRTLGIEPFLYPTGAPFCATDDNLPLGIVPAVGGAIPGPWPATAPLPGLDFEFDFDLVDPAETLFAFVPTGLDADADASGIQLAWFNVNTFQGGFVPMSSPGETLTAAVPEQLRGFAGPIIDRFLADALPMGGVRVAPVETGSGTVLSAIFGTVRNGDTTCFFLPTIGIVDVPA